MFFLSATRETQQTFRALPGRQADGKPTPPGTCPEHSRRGCPLITYTMQIKILSLFLGFDKGIFFPPAICIIRFLKEVKHCPPHLGEKMK